MFNIADYFKKFSKIEEDSRFLKDSVHEVIHEVCGPVSVTFKIQKGILYIQGSNTVKSIIHTKKSHILSLLKSKIPQKNIFDIR